MRMKMVTFSFFFCLLHLGGEVDAVLWKSAGTTKPGLSTLPLAQNKLNFARELRFYQLLAGERGPAASARNGQQQGRLEDAQVFPQSSTFSFSSEGEGEESDVEVPIVVSHDSEEVDLEDDDDEAACRKHAAWRQTLQANAWRHVEDAFFRLSSLEQKEVLRKKRWLRKTLLRRLDSSSGLQGLDVSSSTSPCAGAGSSLAPGRGTGREAEIRQRREKLEELGRSMAHGGDAGGSSGEVGEQQVAAPGDGDDAPEGGEIEMSPAGAGEDAEAGAEAHDVTMKEAGEAAAKTNVEQREKKEAECNAAGEASPPTKNKKKQKVVGASKTRTELPMPIKKVAPRPGTSGEADAHSNANSTSTRATPSGSNPKGGTGCRFAVLRGDEDSDSDGRESDLEPAAATTALDQLRAGVPEPDPEPKGVTPRAAAAPPSDEKEITQLNRKQVGATHQRNEEEPKKGPRKKKKRGKGGAKAQLAEAQAQADEANAHALMTPNQHGSSSSGNGGRGGEGGDEEGVDGIPDKLLTCDGMPLMLAKLMRDWGIYMEPKSWEEIKEVLTAIHDTAQSDYKAWQAKKPKRAAGRDEYRLRLRKIARAKDVVEGSLWNEASREVLRMEEQDCFDHWGNLLMDAHVHAGVCILKGKPIAMMTNAKGDAVFQKFNRRDQILDAAEAEGDATGSSAGASGSGTAPPDYIQGIYVADLGAAKLVQEALARQNKTVGGEKKVIHRVERDEHPREQLRDAEDWDLGRDIAQLVARMAGRELPPGDGAMAEVEREAHSASVEEDDPVGGDMNDNSWKQNEAGTSSGDDVGGAARAEAEVDEQPPAGAGADKTKTEEPQEEREVPAAATPDREAAATLLGEVLPEAERGGQGQEVDVEMAEATAGAGDVDLLTEAFSLWRGLRAGQQLLGPPGSDEERESCSNSSTSQGESDTTGSTPSPMTDATGGRDGEDVSPNDSVASQLVNGSSRPSTSSASSSLSASSSSSFSRDSSPPDAALTKSFGAVARLLFDLEVQTTFFPQQDGPGPAVQQVVKEPTHDEQQQQQQQPDELERHDGLQEQVLLFPSAFPRFSGVPKFRFANLMQRSLPGLSNLFFLGERYVYRGRYANYWTLDALATYLNDVAVAVGDGYGYREGNDLVKILASAMEELELVGRKNESIKDPWKQYVAFTNLPFIVDSPRAGLRLPFGHYLTAAELTALQKANEAARNAGRLLEQEGAGRSGAFALGGNGKVGGSKKQGTKTTRGSKKPVSATRTTPRPLEVLRELEFLPSVKAILDDEQKARNRRRLWNARRTPLLAFGPLQQQANEESSRATLLREIEREIRRSLFGLDIGTVAVDIETGDRAMTAPSKATWFVHMVPGRAMPLAELKEICRKGDRDRLEEMVELLQEKGAHGVQWVQEGINQLPRLVEVC